MAVCGVHLGSDWRSYFCCDCNFDYALDSEVDFELDCEIGCGSGCGCGCDYSSHRSHIWEEIGSFHGLCLCLCSHLPSPGSAPGAAAAIEMTVCRVPNPYCHDIRLRCLLASCQPSRHLGRHGHGHGNTCLGPISTGSEPQYNKYKEKGRKARS
ncbi:hypothetical protein H113_07440 [Trichophyton rubrum MR1459]|uniref:Uncharacterized protein n=1 Tax=Trichophyton rubrum (strain ATCC MYA-4607 / CBS 118892) TaxID=559305 RepID=A0A080WHW0_TRIRC|nr:uncharacterized protein TERG_11881 [Trichophyton rubrum CBS 118892]EZF91682.1 hypothetical protein H113_07440 [Trichophyton rubrum MR1459]EZG02871.1 hypothetical protein H106_07224 [Trichophyton rubrum CBS 735.88]KFL60944.1 hypothetical protein TERG_11881 [Trichophyton rubrum CBS 118892]